MDLPAAKEHRRRQAGPKARRRASIEKKRSQNAQHSEGNAERRNDKAFAFNSVKKATKMHQRRTDREFKSHHVPIKQNVDPNDDAPPVLIAVVGPPQVGKSTLIRDLVRHYTKQRLSNVSGPITVISGKKRRLTFFECPNDVPSMLDLAKSTCVNWFCYAMRS